MHVLMVITSGTVAVFGAAWLCVLPRVGAVEVIVSDGGEFVKRETTGPPWTAAHQKG